MHVRLAHSSLAPRLALLAALVFALFTMSGARLVVDGAREATRSTAPTSRTQNAGHWRRRFSLLRGHAAGSKSAVVRVLRAVVQWLARPPHLPAVLGLQGLAHGADALGVSVPRRRRWLVMGGHGRHGAG